MANDVFVTPADDPTTRLAEGISGVLQNRAASDLRREDAGFEREKLQNAVRLAEIGREGTLGAAGIGALSRREVADISATQQGLNRETQLEVARMAQNAKAADDRIGQLKAERDFLRDSNEEAGRNARNEANIQSDEDKRDLAELQGNMLESKSIKDARGIEIVNATTWGAYASEPRTRDRRITEGLVRRSMDPAVYSRVREVMLDTLDASVKANRFLFETETNPDGSENPSFQDARAYYKGAKQVSDDFKKNSGSYVLQGMTSEEEVQYDLEFRRDLASATEAYNRQLAQERLNAPVEEFPEPGLLTP